MKNKINKKIISRILWLLLTLIYIFIMLNYYFRFADNWLTDLSPLMICVLSLYYSKLKESLPKNSKKVIILKKIVITDVILLVVLIFVYFFNLISKSVLDIFYVIALFVFFVCFQILSFPRKEDVN